MSWWFPENPICIKRALAKLRVAADWQAPVERSLYEAKWMQVDNAAVAGVAPALLGQDAGSGMLAMRFLDPERYPLWKGQLHEGKVDVGFAASVGEALGRIHAATAPDDGLRALFPRMPIFLHQAGPIFSARSRLLTWRIT